MEPPPPAQRVAVVCASNMNRSMEAHRVFAAAGANVRSFGVGQHVKLPGPTQKQPNVYPFGTTYRAIYEDLKAKDPELYTRNGLLPMLERNMSLKPAPERWQSNIGVEFDVVVAFEERVFEQIIEDLQSREGARLRPVLVLNLDVKDNATEAAVAAPLALGLCGALAQYGEDWAVAVDGLLAQFEAAHARRPLYRICFY